MFIFYIKAFKNIKIIIINNYLTIFEILNKFKKIYLFFYKNKNKLF